MTVQTLTPTTLTADNSGTNINGLLAAATQTQIQFVSNGTTVLFVLSTGTTTTVTTNIGASVLGQSVTSFTPVTMTSANVLYCFGPFHSAVNQVGTNIVQVTLNSITGVSLAAVQLPGVY